MDNIEVNLLKLFYKISKKKFKIDMFTLICCLFSL